MGIPPCGLLLEAALNGTRTRAEHPAIPLEPEQQAREARAAVAQGAHAIHVHVRDARGHESLDPGDIAGTLHAIRGACPGVPIGVSTGAWIVPDLSRRLSLIRAWNPPPDFASVNLHEAGAFEVIRLMLSQGIGVEAGIWNAPAALALARSGLADGCLRVLIEPADGSCGSCGARANLQQIESALEGVERPRLLHGHGPTAWEFVALATSRGYQTRIGFEDTLRLPDRSCAPSNADLVAAARRIMQSASSASHRADVRPAVPASSTQGR